MFQAREDSSLHVGSEVTRDLYLDNYSMFLALVVHTVLIMFLKSNFKKQILHLSGKLLYLNFSEGKKKNSPSQSTKNDKGVNDKLKNKKVYDECQE